MPPFFSILLGISFTGLIALFLYRGFKSGYWGRFWLQILGLGLALAAIYALFWSGGTVQAKGEATVTFVFVLYLCMVLGMLAQAAYSRFDQPKKERPPFEVGAFLAPVFASPIIFIPLLAALQNADVDLAQMTASRIMVFFVAFENGFFWKEYFDHRRERRKQGGDDE